MIGAAVPKDPITLDKCQCCGTVNPEFPSSTSPFCVRCAARKRCSAQSPLSGYEPVYMPRLYNAKKYTLHNHNCFAYAFDIMDLPTAEECNGNDKEECKVPFHQPGYFSGQKRFDESGEKRCFDLFTRLKSDMPAIEIARNGRPIYFTDKPAKGYSKIALVIDPQQDYHFYRQDSNGFWSHKPGGTPVKNKDTSGRLIYNPELANRDSRDDADNTDGLNYKVFCGFMCVPRLLPNRAKRGGGNGGTANVLTRKLQRLVGGMNNNNNNNTKMNNNLPVKTKQRTFKVRKSVKRFMPIRSIKTVKVGRSAKVGKSVKLNGALPLPNDPNMARRKMMAIVTKLKSTYPDIVITKEEEKALRDVALASTLPKYNPGRLFGMIQKKYGRVNPTIGSEVRGVFRDAGFLPVAGATTSKVQRKMRGVTSRKSQQQMTVNVPTVNNSMSKYNRARRAAERNQARALILLQASQKPRKARRTASSNPVDVKTETVLDIIRETGASPAEITHAITVGKQLLEAQRTHTMPPRSTNPLEDGMADLLGALEDAAGTSGVLSNNNNNINVRAIATAQTVREKPAAPQAVLAAPETVRAAPETVRVDPETVRANLEDDELAAAMGRLGF